MKNKPQKFAVNDIVRAKGNDPKFAFFRVLSARNGWLRCMCVRHGDGTATSPEWRGMQAADPVKFRASEMEISA